MKQETNILKAHLVQILKSAQGWERAVKLHQLEDIMKDMTVQHVTNRMVQHLVREIRLEGLVPCLVADHHGLYIANNYKHLVHYLKAQRKKLHSILEVVQALERQMEDRYADQVDHRRKDPQLSLFSEDQMTPPPTEHRIDGMYFVEDPGV